MTDQTQPKKTQVGASICILLSGTLWGIIGLWNRSLMAAGFTSTNIVTIRNFCGMLLLAAIFLMKDRRVFQVKRGHLKYFLGTGIVSILFFTTCYFTCQQICSLAVASVLLYTAPAFVVIMSAVLWKEPLTRKKLLALLLTLIGCAMTCGIFAGDLSVTIPGILLGLGAGFFYAMYSIFGRYALAHYDSMTVTVWTFIFAGPASLVFFRPAELSAVAEKPQLGLMILGLVVFSTVLPYILYTRGLSQVESGKASIMASVEVVVAALTGVLMFGEPMTIQTLAGIVCVLVGVYILR